MYKWSITGHFTKELEVAFNKRNSFYPVLKITKAADLDQPNSRASAHLDDADRSYEIKFVSNAEQLLNIIEIGSTG